MHQAQWSPERPLPPPVSLASQSHHEKPPEVTCTSRGVARVSCLNPRKTSRDLLQHVSRPDKGYSSWVFSSEPHHSPFFLNILQSSNLMLYSLWVHWGFPCGSAGKEYNCNVGDLGLIPGLGRSPREGKGYPLQYSGLENSMGCIVHGVAKSQA